MLYGMGKHVDIIGRRFGALTVLSDTVPGESLRRAVVQCDCGEVRNVYRCHLMAGRTSSCGCQKSARITSRKTQHGCARAGGQTCEYRTWKGMVERCHNPSIPNFHRYGGRGITVCDRWRNDFAAFLADVGPRPSPAHSIDRVDNDRGYEPDNVRWATRMEQAKNTRTNVWITAFGETLHAAEWARRFSLHCKTIIRRLDRGWTPERALAQTPAYTGFARKNHTT